ncbi:MAG TPA: tRNA pseudouridine(38-40) synthase TruA [Ilumatobacteraceae bacterium]
MNEPVALRRVRLVVAYDGSSFHGFAANAGVRTVVGELTAALSTVTRWPVDVVGAGRTDAGVHAWGQVVSCDIPAATDLGGLQHRLNSMCGPAVAVRAAEWVDDAFSARFDAQWRQYRYTVLNSAVPHPLLATTTWHVHRPLSLAAMQLACDPLIGENDFTSFCRRPPVAEGAPAASLHRYVMLARWADVTREMQALMDPAGDARLLRFEIRANAFCHQMVRSIMGMMIDIGHGRQHAGDVRSIMRARDRHAAPRLAPPQGLVLWEVGYYPSERIV